MPKKSLPNLSEEKGKLDLVDDKWVFPELASEIVALHKDFFSNKDLAGVPLSARELALYGDGTYPAGWRFQLKTASFSAILLLDRFTPFSAPRIALKDEEFFLKWPHVEENGLLCLRDDTDTIDHFAGVSLTEYYIKRAELLIEQNLNGEIGDDFATEFNSYWNRWCDRKRRQSKKVLLLPPLTTKSQKIYTFSIPPSIVVCESVEHGLKWANSVYTNKDIKDEDFQAGAFIWLPEPLMPERYPKTNYSAAEIAKSGGEEAFAILSGAVPNEAGSTIMVFGFESGNGPAYGGIQLNEPKHNLRPGKQINSRNKGFRQKRRSSGAGSKRYFTAEGKIEALRVQRVDRHWIFERGSSGLNNRIESACVGIIGCGSIGSQVVRLLVESGVRKLILIDPDDLSWDNIGRHLLGAQHTGQNKAAAIKKYLESQFPNQLEIGEKTERWQVVFSEDRDVFLNCDLLISTIGDWDSESALNYSFNTVADFPMTIYGWTEPYGFVGHALAIFGVGGCLSCGMDDRGEFRYPVTQWNLGTYHKRPPACGQTYQPYGALDVTATQSLIAKLSIDVLTKKVTHSQHRVWVGDVSSLSSAEGRLSNNWREQHPGIIHGNRTYIKDWTINKNCKFRHKG